MIRNNNFIIREIGETKILVPLGESISELNGFVILNDTAFLIWELLEQERTLNDLAVAVAGQFDIDMDTAICDTNIFIEQIGQLGLLV